MSYWTDDAEWRQFNDGSEGVDSLYVRIHPGPDGRVAVCIAGGWDTESLYCGRDDLERLIDLLAYAKKYARP